MKKTEDIDTITLCSLRSDRRRKEMTSELKGEQSADDESNKIKKIQ